MILDRHHIILYFALAGALTVGASIWHEKEIDQIRAQATINVEHEVEERAKADGVAAAAREKQRDDAAAAQLADMQASVAKVQTPQQIASWIAKQPGFGSLGTLKIPKATVQDPSPSATASIPSGQLPELRDSIEKCQECAVRLTTAQADLVSRDDRLRAAGQQLSAVMKERDSYRTLSKGGTLFTRVKRSAKLLGIGVIAGAAAVCGSGHCK